LCGITPYHIRLLCDDPWNGGKGQQLSEVCTWTLDQVLMMLADRKLLRAKMDKNKGAGRKTSPAAVAASAGKDGMIRGRAADGTPILGRVVGKSKARQLMEAAQERKKRGG